MLTAPIAGETLTILREQDLTQELDLVENDPFPAQSLEDALDKLTFMVQQHSEEIDRSIKASRTNTITSTEFTVSAATRANKIFAFDSAGELAVTQELGTYRGNWATATAFAQRDIVKDTSDNNIYIVVTAHTSTGSQPISSNADVAKWALIVDAASATTSASAAASSASAASTSATNASNSATAASGSASAAASSASAAAGSASTASTQATNAAASAASAAASFDAFDDIYLGSYATNPTLDNDGNALTVGDQYFNSVANELRVWNGTTWQAASTVGGTVSSLEVTGVASFADGTAAAPSITNTGDLNTGLFFPAADVVAISTGGVERLRVNSLGKLNINTGTLGTQLEVNGSFAAGDSYIAKAASSTMFMRNLSGVNRIDSYDYPITASYPLQILGSPLTFFTVDTERMRIDSSGNVGIGTSSPQAKLDIGDTSAAFTASIIRASTTGIAELRFADTVDNAGFVSYDHTSNYMRFATSATERMRIDSSGNVSIGGYTPGLGTRLAMYGGIRFLTTETAANTYTGIGSIASDTVSISTSGTERMSIGTSGVVTIANLAGAGSRAVNASATGVLSAASDSRLKQEVPEAPIAGLAEIMQLRPVAYKWLGDIANRGDEAAVELGFFADEAKDIIPSAAPMGNDGYYGFYDRAVIAALSRQDLRLTHPLRALCLTLA
jgi:hypothetical protein